MKRIVVVLGVLLGAWSVVAQEVRFESLSHHFGELKEEEGPVQFTFKFENTGKQPVQVTQVEASCGCTTPGWTQEPVQPGETGEVIAEYDPAARPGSFEKSLTVSFKGAPSITLQISGVVLPRPRTVEDELPVLLGALRVKNKSISMGRITNEKPIETRLHVYNAGQEPLQWKPAQASLPTHIKVKYIPEVLEPASYGELVITYDPVKRDDLGFMQDQISLMTNEEEGVKAFTLMVSIEEYFPPMSADELAKASKLAVDKKQVDFGELLNSSVREATLQLTNHGATKLHIRKLESNCACLTAKSKAMSIAPGATVELKLYLNPAQLKGRQYKSLTIFSNDPAASAQMIQVRADVK